jgi:hypothetical protein
MRITFDELRCSLLGRNLFSEIVINLYWNRLCCTCNSLIVIVRDSENSEELEHEVHAPSNVINVRRCSSSREL